MKSVHVLYSLFLGEESHCIMELWIPSMTEASWCRKVCELGGLVARVSVLMIQSSKVCKLEV